MDRHDKINTYIAMFTKVYGEEPSGDLTTLTDEELDQVTEQTTELYRQMGLND